MISRSLAGQLFRDRRDGQVYKTSLLGAFQPLNAILAIAVLESVVPCAQRVQGIEQAKWPGRLELLNADMPVLIDGAHNPQGCSALGNDLRFFLSGKDVVLLSGMLADKDYSTMLRSVLADRTFHVRAFIATEPANPRKLSATALADKAKIILQESILSCHASATESAPNCHLIVPSPSVYNESYHTNVMNDAVAAAEYAAGLAFSEKAALCVFGSLYLIGTVRPVLRRILIERKKGASSGLEDRNRSI